MSIWADHAEPRTPSRGRRVIRAVALSVALALAVAGTVVATDSQKAFAVDYPSWNDVISARQSENATVTAIAQISALIESLRAEVARTEADAIAKGELYQEADQAFQEAALKAQKLQSQADEKEALAAQSKQQAGEIVAQQYRSGNGDVSTNLLVNAAKADDILYTFGMADKFTEQTAAIYEKALQDQNTAVALTKQAQKAQGLLEELKLVAEAAAEAAQAAAEAAAQAVVEQEENQDTLSAQLTVLQERRAVTEADYMTGVAVRAEAARLKAIADAAAAAAAGAGVVGQSGWAKPTYGAITSGFGNRLNPVSHKWLLHAGTDMSSGCGKPIYAAHAGVVGMAAPNGSYGNYIRIDNGDGIATAYGHIVNGGTLVSKGQSVASGQLIAYVGTTGGSTGCHLHYEVRINGVATDAVPFMRNQGITLG